MQNILLCAIFFLVVPSLATDAQKQIKFDSASVAVRQFNSASIQKLKEDKAFQYNKYSEPIKSIWEKFWEWVWFKIVQVMSTKAGRNTVYTVFIILAVAALAFFVMKVVGMDGGRLFGRKGGEGLDYDVTSDDIHLISFDEAIDNALASGNFRLAARLLYLQSLKQLSDKGFIHWTIDKTNRDYINEVASEPWYSLFKSITNKFEYVWYGETNIGRGEFERLQVQFQQLNNQL